MIQKTTYKRAKSPFNMAVVTDRIKKRFRKKLKKTIKKSKIRKVWKDFVDIQVIEPLIEKGKVQVDKRFALEIVGQRIVDNPNATRLLTSLQEGSKVKLSQTRRGFIHRIIMHEDRFKEGLLIFEPGQRMKKAMNHSLKTTNTYYRILNVTK